MVMVWGHGQDLVVSPLFVYVPPNTTYEVQLLAFGPADGLLRIVVEAFLIVHHISENQ